MFLGIDLGTSSVKVVVIDDHQTVLAAASAPLQVSRPQPLWSEQDPRQWWQATQLAISVLRKDSAQLLSQVRSIGLSGQMHGATLLDRFDQPLRAAILWNDGRAEPQCQTFLQREPRALEITGNLIMPGFTAPKLIWVAEHEPHIFSQIHKVILPKDYLRLMMTGVYATDVSDASGTLWLQTSTRRWSHDLLAASGLSEKNMPALFEGTEVTAQIKPEIAAEWGIPTTATVVAGGGDNAATAVSMGVIDRGQAFLSLGTSGVYFTADDTYRAAPHETMHTFCHCLPKRWQQMSVHLSAASCLDWVSRLIGCENTEELIDRAKSHRSKDTPVFLPYLSGERTPYNDPHARGVLMGLTQESSSNEIVQAVLEGVAFVFELGQQVLINAGVEISSVSVTGGGSRSAYWGSILATVLNRPLIYRRQAAIGGAYGAARLAWYSEHGGELSTVFTMPEIEHIIYPSADLTSLSNRQKIFHPLYRKLQPMFKLLNN